MPLVRAEVRNEYGLGAPELYRDVDKEDPKAVLDGVAVAGLVGILRQLGDLAEFSAEIFHGLQEQLMVISSRSHKMMTRVRKLEATLPSLEKAVLAQRSHLHFAYTAGTTWHSHIQCDQNHFIYDDLPRFIMDSYEECRGPPRLDLLDKFDPGGPGSCLKRYTDPTFFKKATVGSNGEYIGKVLKDKKARRMKRKKMFQRTVEASRGASFSSYSGRIQISPRKVSGQSSLSRRVSNHDATVRSDDGFVRNSLSSRDQFDSTEHGPQTTYSAQSEEQVSKGSFSSSIGMRHSNVDFGFLDEKSEVMHDDIDSFSPDQKRSASSFGNWENKGQSEVREVEGCISSKVKIHNNGTLDYGFLDEIPEIVNADSGNSCLLEQILRTSSHVSLDDKIEVVQPKQQVHDPAKVICDVRNDTYAVGQISPPLSSLTLDKETEAMGLKQQVHGHAEDSITSYAHLNLDDHEKESITTGWTEFPLDGGTATTMSFADVQLMEDERHVEKTEHGEMINLQLNIENSNTLDSASIPHDGNESETDQYVDALNTIESESEMDGDSQMKREVKHDVTVNSLAVSDEAQMSSIDLSVSGFSYSGHGTGTEIASGLHTCQDNSITVSPASNFVACSASTNVPVKAMSQESNSSPGSPQASNRTVSPGRFEDVNSGGSGDSHPNAKAEPDILGISSSFSREYSSFLSKNDKLTNSASEIPKPPPQTPTVPSVKIWTNGGLLGLEPSKPPDFGALNAISQVSASILEDSVETEVQHNTYAYEKLPGKPRIRDRSSKILDDGSGSKCYSSCQVSQGGTSAEKGSSIFARGNGYEKSSQSDPANGTNSYDTQATRASEECSRSSSRIFELGNRLFSNSFQKRLSLGMDGNSYSTSARSLDDCLYDQSDHCQRAPYESSCKENASPLITPPPSPPLRHMKISFHPVDEFENSKLKLKFPDRINSSESNQNIYPSFQLVPDTDASLHDSGLDSDDDTFCRSSTCVSDDCHSHHSDSNSEQWESGESPSRKDHELYDAFHRISLAESTSRPVNNIETWGALNNNHGLRVPAAENSLDGLSVDHLFDIPSFETLNQSFRDRVVNSLDPQYLQPSLVESTPPPPPLPPVEWRAHPDVSEQNKAKDAQDVISEGLNNQLGRSLSGCSFSQPPKPAPFEQDQAVDITSILKSKRLETEKINGHKEVNQVGTGKKMDENKDFLHQIRTKSFNLRKTAVEKPNVTSGPPTSVKVTAILEKANAIRQAVGSDDGEDDDTWSDT